MRIARFMSLVAAMMVVAMLASCGGSEEAESPDSANAPSAPSETQTQSAEDQAQAPEDETLTVTVPKMARINNSAFPNTFGEDEDSLQNFAGIHLEGTGFPWQEEANVYLAGHRLGYPGYPSFLAFYDIDNLVEGDEIYVSDANGEDYTYRVFQTIEVEPTDLFVTEPLEGRNILTLQTCTLPDYARRLIVQAEQIT